MSLGEIARPADAARRGKFPSEEWRLVRNEIERTCSLVETPAFRHALSTYCKAMSTGIRPVSAAWARNALPITAPNARV